MTDEDVRDALGELANMLAGNLKSVLPSGVVLSMPSVIEGSDYSLRNLWKAVDRAGAVLEHRGYFWSHPGGHVRYIRAASGLDLLVRKQCDPRDLRRIGLN